MPPVTPSGSELPAQPFDASSAPGVDVPSATVIPLSSSVGRTLRRGEWRLLWLIIGLFILRDLPWRLDEYDQAKQAFTSLEMVQAGHWGFQHTPGYRSVATKPPLVGWASAGLYYLTGGNWDWAWRLPSFLSALLLVGLLWRAGEKLWPGWGGTLAAAAFALNQLAPRLASLVRTDMPLTLWITLLGLIVWRHAGGGSPDGTARPWPAGTQRRIPFLDPERHRWLPGLSPDRWAVSFLLLAAMMTKGPIVYAFLLPGMVVYTLIQHRRARQPAKGDPAIGAPDIWGGWWHWVLPLLPFLFWLERGMVTMPGFYQQVVLHEFLGRFTVGEEAVHHNQPVYYYFAQLLTRWAPWSVLLLAVRLRGAAVWWSLWREPGNLWLICWAAGGLVTMSLVPSKRVDRIFPVVPPLCLLTVAALRRAEEVNRIRRAEDAAEGMLPAVTLPSRTEVEQLLLQPTAWPRAWSHRALQAGIILAVGGAVYGAGQAFWQRDDTLTRFGAQVRAAQAGKRVELVTSQSRPSDETLLVYLRRLEFLTPVQALQLWTTGHADALAMSQTTLEKSRGLLSLALPLDHPALTAPAVKEQPAYSLIVRDADAPPLSVPLRLPSPAAEETPFPQRQGGHRRKH